jgi:AraC-like DNA-binding protein
LGVVDLANIAQVSRPAGRYPDSVSPVSKLRRSTRATYVGHGVMVARIENEQRLWYGMKDRHAFVVPDRGSWEFLYRGTTYHQGPGVLQLKQPGEMYRDLRRDGAASYDMVLFEPEIVAAASAASRVAVPVVFATPQLAAGDPRAAALLALRGITETVVRAAGALAIDTAIAEAALVLVSLGAAPRAVGSEARAVQRARAYLLERLGERIRLDDVADHVGLDKFHLIRSFRAQVGVPPYEFVTHARVHRARELLRGGVPAGTAASAVGFCDQSQLHRHFVRLVGVTPGRYAARARSSLRSSVTRAGEGRPAREG